MESDRMKKNSRVWLFLLASLLAASVARAQRAITASGITEPVADATLSSPMAGLVGAWKFKEGDRVKADQAIIELDKRLDELEVERRKLIWESKAELRFAEAQVATRKLIWESKVELRFAEAQVATLKGDVEATRLLFKTSKSVSKEQLDKKELEYKQAVAEYEKVLVAEEREKLEYQQVVADYERVLAAEVREKLEYDLAVETLKRRHIFAPFDGVVVELYKKPGEACQANEKVVRLVDTSRCYFVSNMDAKAGSRLKTGQLVKLEVESGDAFVPITGTVYFVSPIVDPASGLLKVKVLFANPDGKIRPGVSGRVILEEAGRGN